MRKRDRRWGRDTIPTCGCLRGCSHPRQTREYAALLSRMGCATMPAQQHCDHAEALATNAALDAAADAAGRAAMANDIVDLEDRAADASETLPDPADALLGAAMAGAMSFGVLARVAALDSGTLTADQRIARLQIWQRARAFLDACDVDDVAALGELVTDSAPAGDRLRHELGAALRISPDEAGARGYLAQQLVSLLPGSLALLRDGRISAAQARQIAEAVTDLTPDRAAAVEMRVLPAAPTQTTRALRKAAQRAAMAIAPDIAAAKDKAAAERRSVTLYPYAGGASVIAEGPAATAVSIWEALDAVGRKLKAARKADNRVADARGEDPLWTAEDVKLGACRFDALGGMAAEVLDRADLPRRQHARPAVQVQIDAATLLGVAEHPGELGGYGPIPAATARALAADGIWQRLVTDPMTGALLDLSPDTYQPSARLAAYIVARDRHCDFPGCDRQAPHADLDHKIPFNMQDPVTPTGPTVRDNLHPPDRDHHNAKTHGGWTTHTDDSGALVWTSRLGPTYAVPIRTQPCAIPLDPLLERERNPRPAPPLSAFEAARPHGSIDITWYLAA